MARRAREKAYNGAVLDTSVWVAVLVGERVADALPDAQGALETVSTPIVLAELASLAGRGRLADAAAAVEAVVSTSRMESLEPEDGIEAGELHARLRRAGNEKIGLGDCLIYATARRVGALLITADHDLKGEAGVLVLPRPTGGPRRHRS